MKAIRLFYNKDCDKCRRISSIHRKFDWFNRIDVSTDVPRTGPLRLGEIAVEEIATGRVFKGVEAVRQICEQVPLYRPLKLLLALPFVAQRVDRELQGCEGGSCTAPAPSVVQGP